MDVVSLRQSVRSFAGGRPLPAGDSGARTGYFQPLAAEKSLSFSGLNGVRLLERRLDQRISTSRSARDALAFTRKRVTANRHAPPLRAHHTDHVPTRAPSPATFAAVPGPLILLFAACLLALSRGLWQNQRYDVRSVDGDRKRQPSLVYFSRST